MTEATPRARASWIVSALKKRNVQLALILIAWIWTIAAIATKDSQWDFKVYYYATVAYFHGDNPYELETLNQHSPEEIVFPFVYPTLTCYFFRPFTFFPYDVAYQIWLIIKVGLAIYLVWLWRRRFLQWGPLPLMILVATATYLGGFYRDLNSGNVTLIEQALLWTGFYWLLEEKPYRFALAVAAAAFFKFSLAIFLLTILFTRVRQKWTALLLGSAILVGYVTLIWAVDRQSLNNLIETGANIKEYTADFNHSTLAVFHDFGKLLFGNAVEDGAGRNILVATYLLFAAVVATMTFRSFKNFKTLAPRDAVFLAICALCLLYVLVMPRMKNYTFILLVVPTYFLLTTAVNRNIATVLTILLVIPRIKIAAPDSIFGFYQYIHPWLMAVTMWLIFMIHARKGITNLPWKEN